MTVRGIPELQTRLDRLKPSIPLMHTLGLAVIAQQKLAAKPFRKTSNLEHSIHVGSITATSVDTVAGANYALFVERGTGIYGPSGQPIRPKRGKFLRWESGGSRRTGRGKGSTVHFARNVKGRKATPFMLPGARAALAGFGLRDTIVRLWNGR